MGIKWPWEDECDDQIEIDGRTYTRTATPPDQRTNILTLYVVTVCEYLDAAGNIHNEEHTRILWIFDF